MTACTAVCDSFKAKRLLGTIRDLWDTANLSKQVLERAGHIKKGPLGCIATVT